MRVYNAQSLLGVPPRKPPKKEKEPPALLLGKFTRGAPLTRRAVYRTCLANSRKLQKRCAENTTSHSVAAAGISGDMPSPYNEKVVKTLYNPSV